MFDLRTSGVTLALIAGVCGCGDVDPADTAQSPPAAASPPQSSAGFDVKITTTKGGSAVDHPPAFEDRHADLGLRFQYESWATGKNLMVETTGGGCAWGDFDSDGYPDAFFCQGCDPTGGTQGGHYDRMFLSVDGTQFVDVSTKSLVAPEAGYGQGVAVGDFNNDGFPDIYVTNVRGNRLLENQGDGTFADVTNRAGADSPRWSTSSAWADWDRDGDLDLFVCNYVNYDVDNPMACVRDDGKPAMCHPEHLDGVSNCAFTNLGDGTFREAADELGLAGERKSSKSLGVVVADLNGDELPDIYVANDTTHNRLYIGQPTGEFREESLLLGCAANRDGIAQASMGIAFGDYDGNGYPDLYLTHFSQDYNTLYRNLGPSGFDDVTRREGLREPTFDQLAFGTVMYDFNGDGKQELFVANGDIEDRSDRGEEMRMPPQLFSYNGTTWADVSHGAGAYFDGLYVGRSVSVSDFDLDGDLDLLVTHLDQETALLVNQTEHRRWLAIRLIGTRSNRQGIGTQLTLTQGPHTTVAQLPGGTGYCSSQSPVLIFGLEDSSESASLEVRWPGDPPQLFQITESDQSLAIVQASQAGDESRLLTDRIALSQ